MTSVFCIRQWAHCHLASLAQGTSHRHSERHPPSSVFQPGSTRFHVARKRGERVSVLLHRIHQLIQDLSPSLSDWKTIYSHRHVEDYAFIPWILRYSTGGSAPNNWWLDMLQVHMKETSQSCAGSQEPWDAEFRRPTALQIEVFQIEQSGEEMLRNEYVVDCCRHSEINTKYT